MDSPPCPLPPPSQLQSPRPAKRRRVDRVTAACDFCRQRKAKCDGRSPCGYCQRKKRPHTCTFSAPDRPSTPQLPRARQRSGPTSLRQRLQGDDEIAHVGPSLSPAVSRDDHREDTDVPLEARLLRDAQGKVIFIGDCAPLSFLQTVRHLIASEVDPTGASNQLSRDSVVEVAALRAPAAAPTGVPHILPLEVHNLVTSYSVATCGLVNLFEKSQLEAELTSWATGDRGTAAAATRAVYHLVAAIGSQETNEGKADAWHCHAKDLLLENLTSSMSVATVQGFALLAIYMLRAFQPNGAYLYFSLAARTSYAIGLHRTEVNASTAMPGERDRIWKSLRVVDMLISNMLGRPPSTSDVDCTVKYSMQEAVGENAHMLLDANVQIFMIIERVVVEVYSRKRISLRIANFVSHQLKGWAGRWIRRLTAVVDASTVASAEQETIVGACQTLSSYYYSIMLLTRPFLVYELYEHLGATLRGQSSRADNQLKRKFADAALDAAAAFVDVLHRVLATGRMPHRMPLIVSWLFNASLVLAMGIVGRSGLALEENCNTSIQCLDYFASIDPHAQQYATTVRAILTTTVNHVHNREKHFQLQRKQASSELFGLLSKDIDETDGPSEPTEETTDDPPGSSEAQRQSCADAPLDGAWTYYDADFFALPWLDENDQGLQDFLQPGRQTLDGSMADLPLFPMYDHMAGSFG
ncbi:hypothetical protein DOTSEDRAFT_174156 [Dothistroma septosporum NZE10]|uniref:Zn(2)-C6 fungal-type domain-containing protein n=1 Tax=Dothistroma septosporum (strain NZE10 / CBS 128990) TaxID=675120 RepID=M2Y517_DOTSN|nr:hypothetical protein DOTSEDRAFT_174156 [Dothistroma septosporum NZE10]